MDEYGRHRSLERRFLAVRWAGVAFAAFQVWTFYLPYPAGIESLAWLVVGGFATATAALTVLVSRADTLPKLRHIGHAAMAIDTLVLLALVTVHTFDENTAMFAVLYLVPVEAAMRYGLRGAMTAMIFASVAYTLRELWGHAYYGNDLLPASITFRMGIGFLIALAAGSMADAWRRERERVEEALYQERRATEALRRLDDLKTTFLSAVSHELRTPLTSILGFAITLQDRASELRDDHREMLCHIADEAEHLNRVLADMLDVDRVLRGEGELDAQLVDVHELAERVATRIAEREGRRLALDLSPVRARVDPAKFERVLENLLSNALKFAPVGDEIRVVTEQTSDGLLLVVEDRGPGVPEDQRRAIFEPFSHGESGVAHAPGAGMGLSLVDRFSRLHGGEAWVEDRPGGGASFRVLFPTSPPDGSASNQRVRAGPADGT